MSSAYQYWCWSPSCATPVPYPPRVYAATIHRPASLDWTCRYVANTSSAPSPRSRAPSPSRSASPPPSTPNRAPPTFLASSPRPPGNSIWSSRPYNQATDRLAELQRNAADVNARLAPRPGRRRPGQRSAGHGGRRHVRARRHREPRGHPVGHLTDQCRGPARHRQRARLPAAAAPRRVPARRRRPAARTRRGGTGHRPGTQPAGQSGGAEDDHPDEDRQAARPAPQGLRQHLGQPAPGGQLRPRVPVRTRLAGGPVRVRPDRQRRTPSARTAPARTTARVW